EPVKYRIEYKNTDTLHLAYYDFSKHEQLNDSVYQWVLKNQQPIKKAVHILPKDEPYFQTSTEILGEKLPLGNYLLVGYANEKDRLSFDYKDRKSTRLNSSHVKISYAVFCLKKKKEVTRLRISYHKALYN